jgi:hypothetical protein
MNKLTLDAVFRRSFLNLGGSRGSGLRRVVSVQLRDGIGRLVVLLDLVQDELDLAEDAEQRQERNDELQRPILKLARRQDEE